MPSPISLQEEVLRALKDLESWSRIEEIAHAADLSVVTTKKHIMDLWRGNKVARQLVRSGKRGRPAFVYLLPEKVPNDSV
jgi:predicted ArsR family transcriptional regulator